MLSITINVRLDEQQFKQVIDLGKALGDEMATLTEAVQSVKDALGTLASDIATELQQLKDAVAAGQDVADNIATLEGLASQVGQLSADLKADDPAPPA